MSKNKRSMEATETYLILCQMDAGEITLQEAHELILRLFGVVERSEQLKDFLLFIQENAPNYRTKQLKPDQVIKAYLESL
jgi:hypothetical protein